ncbi:hypothetical protein WMF28_27950 [Sorangium sp. So ce590]|uniref:hypothetical protein n=1 Tax=Sorangium sp. So ce590 TaxID=3133317 RepID=UPI003F5D7333
MLFDNCVQLMVPQMPMKKEPPEYVRSRLNAREREYLHRQLLAAVVIGLRANVKPLCEGDGSKLALSESPPLAKQVNLL